MANESLFPPRPPLIQLDDLLKYSNKPDSTPMEPQHSLSLQNFYLQKSILDILVSMMLDLSHIQIDASLISSKYVSLHQQQEELEKLKNKMLYMRTQFLAMLKDLCLKP